MGVQHSDLCARIKKQHIKLWLTVRSRTAIADRIIQPIFTPLAKNLTHEMANSTKKHPLRPYIAGGEYALKPRLNKYAPKPINRQPSKKKSTIKRRMEQYKIDQQGTRNFALTITRKNQQANRSRTWDK